MPALPTSRAGAPSRSGELLHDRRRDLHDQLGAVVPLGQPRVRAAVVAQVGQGAVAVEAEPGLAGPGDQDPLGGALDPGGQRGRVDGGDGEPGDPGGLVQAGHHLRLAEARQLLGVAGEHARLDQPPDHVGDLAGLARVEGDDLEPLAAELGQEPGRGGPAPRRDQQAGQDQGRDQAGGHPPGPGPQPGHPPAPGQRDRVGDGGGRGGGRDGGRVGRQPGPPLLEPGQGGLDGGRRRRVGRGGQGDRRGGQLGVALELGQGVGAGGAAGHVVVRRRRGAGGVVERRPQGTEVRAGHRRLPGRRRHCRGRPRGRPARRGPAGPRPSRRPGRGWRRSPRRSSRRGAAAGRPAAARAGS